MEEENIITVRNRNLQKADEAFADFMFMLESYLNEKAAAIPGTYCDCKSKELENVEVNGKNFAVELLSVRRRYAWFPPNIFQILSRRNIMGLR